MKKRSELSPVYPEDELLPLSALQHLAFCRRQCALIHIEGLWLENRLTAEGRLMHERTHDGTSGLKGEVYLARSLPLRSLVLGLAGKADMVEFHPVQESGESASGKMRAAVELAALPGRWRVYPVEYKRGRPKQDNCDMVQLCAQAICLEEMLDTDISEGAIYYGRTHHRQKVLFTMSLRDEVAELSARLHDLIRSGRTPPPEYGKKCGNCSLQGSCMPRSTRSRSSASSYLDQVIHSTGKAGEDG